MTPRLLYYLRRHTLRLIDFENTSCIIQDKVKTWEQRKFGDLADYKKGPFGSAITKNMFVPKSDDSVKVYEQQNAINKDWSLERYFLPKDYVLNKLKSFEVHGGDIIVSCAGTIGEIYEIPENAEDGVINQALMRVRVNKDIVDKKMFIISFINMIDDFTRAHSNGSAIKNIPPFADLKPMNVLIPSIEEQKRISGFFDNLDNLITLHQRKLNLICYIFKTWEQRKLGEIGTAKSGIGFPDAEQGGAEGIPFFKVSDMNTEGNENELVVANNYVTKEQISRKKWNVIDDVPAIFFAKVGAAVMLNRKRLVRFPFLLDNNTMAYVFDKGIWDCNFGKTLFETIDLTKLTQVGALPSYNASDVEDVCICIPDRAEQEVIGKYFKQLDNLITLHRRTIS